MGVSKALKKQTRSNTKLKPPATPKGCRSFAGMVNFVSIFCPELQKLLKPIYDLIKKGRPFLWEKKQQDTFEENQKQVTKTSSFQYAQ